MRTIELRDSKWVHEKDVLKAFEDVRKDMLSYENDVKKLVVEVRRLREENKLLRRMHEQARL